MIRFRPTLLADGRPTVYEIHEIKGCSDDAGVFGANCPLPQRHRVNQPFGSLVEEFVF